MGFDLVTDQIIVVEDDPARVVGKHRQADIVRPPRRAHPAGGASDEGLEQPALGALQISIEQPVLAVLGPSLGEGLDLDISGFAPYSLEVVADGVQVAELEAQWPAPPAVRPRNTLPREPEQRFIVFGKVDVEHQPDFVTGQPHGRRRFATEPPDIGGGPNPPAFDQRVEQADEPRFRVGAISLDPQPFGIALPLGCLFGADQTKVGEHVERSLGDGVGHPR